MTDQKPSSENILQSPPSIEQNSTTCLNNNPDVPATTLGTGNDQLFEDNNASSSKKTTVEVVELKDQVAPTTTTTVATNPKKEKGKNKKIKKKKSDDVSTTTGEALSSSSSSTATPVPAFNPPSVPVYCKKCLGRNVGKKGERSDAYVITCSKCGAHEVLMKPDGNGVVKINDPGAQALPQGDLLDAAWKSVGEKVFSALESPRDDYQKQQNQHSTRITTFAQRLQYFSRECADLYPLIINLRSLQLKKTSSTPQQRKILETEIKDRLSLLEDGICEIEAFENLYLKKSPAAQSISGSNADPARKKGCPSTNSSSSAGATSGETKESAFRANPSLFDPLSSATTSTSGAASVVEETKPVQALGSAAANVSAESAVTVPSKVKSSPWYIEKAEELNSRLEVMHCHLTKYCMIQSLLIQNKAQEAIAKVKRRQSEVNDNLSDFTEGMIDQCRDTTKDCCQKMESKRKDIKKKQKLLAEARSLADRCIASGDEEGLRRIEEMLRQINLEN